MADKEYSATEGNAEKFGEGAFVTRGASVDRGEAERVAANEDLHRGMSLSLRPSLPVTSELTFLVSQASRLAVSLSSSAPASPYDDPSFVWGRSQYLSLPSSVHANDSDPQKSR